MDNKIDAPRIAVFAGSFDPMTVGHWNILQRALPLFDKIIVAVGINTEKHCCQPLDERMAHLNRLFSSTERIEVASYSGLTVDFCHEHGARYLLRGVRNMADFEYERNIADINRTVAPDIETVILFAEPQYAAISSTMVRELMTFGKEVQDFIV